MMFYSRLKELASEKKKTFNQIEQALGYGKNSLYEGKRSQPSAQRVAELAQYFGVSQDYLMGTTNERVPDLDSLFKGVLNYNGIPLTEHDKKQFRDYLDGKIEARVETRMIGD